MKRLADGLELLDAPHVVGFNIYLLDGVVIDSGSRQSPRRIVRELRGRDVEAVALTNVHPDHAGGAADLCERLGVPLWVGAGDAEAMERGSPNYAREGMVQKLLTALWNGRGHPVARRLREGDPVGSFTVLETPGVTPGHISFWRESDRTLLAGEVMNNLHAMIPLARMPPHEPVAFGTTDRRRNGESARRLAALDPALVCFCHGPPLRDPRPFVERASSTTW